jgi:Ca-activated chloride channel family protein
MAPLLRVAAISAMTWGFLSLWLVVEQKIHAGDQVPAGKEKHLVLVIDVSPSMSLKDAGMEKDATRRDRAVAVLQSLFDRVPIREYRISIIAVYSDAKPMLEDSRDFEVARHILSDMPLWHAFKPGKTDLFSGLTAAAKMCKSWNPGSTTIIVLTDGDSVPPKGMPTLPHSVANVLVIGVGDTAAGMFIDGHQSRQDAATLRQVANRLRGFYHNGNQKHLPSQIIHALNDSYRMDEVARWSRREWSVFAIVAGALAFSLLPILLTYFGSSWKPGVKPCVRAKTVAPRSVRPVAELAKTPSPP